MNEIGSFQKKKCAEILGDTLAGVHLKTFRKVGFVMSSDKVRF